MRDFQRPGRSLVYATNGLCAASHPLTAQVAVRMLQDGGNAVDAAIAAAVLSGFTEPPACGLGGDCFVLMKPAGGERLVGLNGSGRAPAGLDPAALRAAGHTAMPTLCGRGGDRAGGGGRLRAARGRLGSARARRLPRSGDRLCRGGGAGGAAHRARLAGRGDAADRGGAAVLPAGRRGAGARPALPRPGPGRGAAAGRPRRARCLLPGRGGRGHGRLAAGAGRHAHAGGFRRHRLQLRRADRRRLPRPRAGRAAAERPGRDRDPDGQDPRPVRSRPPRSPRRGQGASRGRGVQARLRCAQPLRRRSRRRPAAAGPHAGRRHRRAVGGADRPWPGDREAGGGQRGDPPRDRLSLRRRPRPDGGVDDLFDLSRLRLGARLDPLRDQLPEPRRRVQPDAGPPERGWRRQAAPAYHHPGDAPARRAAGDAVRSDAAATTSPPATSG